MAKEWYLIKPPMYQFGADDDLNIGFNDAMASGIAQDVEIYNYDLSVCRPARAVILNTVQDTVLKSLTRNLLFPIGSCVAGEYVKMKDRFWLIAGIVDDNTVYEKAILSLCNYALTWLDKDGNVVQRWANVTSASQYNHGETSSQHVTVRSDQLLVKMPNDDTTLMLDSGQRFVVDRRCKIYEKQYDETVLKDTSKSLIIYRLTRIDNVLYDYQDSGTSEFVFYQDEQQEDDGYYVKDGKGYWLCGQPTHKDISPSYIECESDMIYNGLGDVSFTAHFINENDEDDDTVMVQWEILCDFEESLNVQRDGKTIRIAADNTKLINKQFYLIANADGYEPIAKTIHIRAFF